MRIEDRADQNPGIERHGLAGLEINFSPGIFLEVEQELHQLVALVVGAGDVVAAAEIEPFELAEEGLEIVEGMVPGALQRREILFAQGVHVEAIDQRDMFFSQLVDGETEPRMRRARVIARHFAFGVERVDSQANVEALAARPRRLDDRAAPDDLAGRVENHVVRQAQHFIEIVGLVCGRIGRDLTVIELGGEPRFPQAGGADAVEILPDDRRDRPHREGLERGKHFYARLVADIGKDRQVRAQFRGVHHEGGAIDPGKVEMGESAWVSGFSFH